MARIHVRRARAPEKGTMKTVTETLDKPIQTGPERMWWHRYASMDAFPLALCGSRSLFDRPRPELIPLCKECPDCARIARSRGWE